MGPSARGTSDAQVGQARWRARLVSVGLRPTDQPLVIGVVVAALVIVAETVLGICSRGSVRDGLRRGIPDRRHGGSLGGVLGDGGDDVGGQSARIDYFHVRSAGGALTTNGRDWGGNRRSWFVAIAANTLAEGPGARREAAHTPAAEGRSAPPGAVVRPRRRD